MLWGKDTAVESEQDWRKELSFMVDFMRDLSLQTEAQPAAALYGQRLRQSGLIPADGFMAISRRDLKFPEYRITRSTKWKEVINPWQEKHRLPLFDRGLISKLIYANEPAIIENLFEHYSSDDPCAEYFEGMKLLVALPNFDGGESINMNIMMARDVNEIPRERIPMMLMQANLWGRSVLNFVLRKQLKTAYDTLDHELKQVGQMQRSLLPSKLPKISGLELAAHYETSQRAGGDYYDFFDLPDNRWGILIADVSGHGTPAAVTMAILHAIAHARPSPATPPGIFLAQLNSALESRYLGGKGSFITAFYAIFDPATRELTYASAGHPPPRLARGGTIRPIDGKGELPLGILNGVSYPEHELVLQPGDRIAFYTDGVSEAFNAAGEQYGPERLDAILLKSNGNTEQSLAELLADLKAHRGERAIADDQTLLMITVAKN